MVWAWRIQRRRGSGRLIHRAGRPERDPVRFCGREHLHGRHHIRQPARRGAVPPVLSHGLPNPAKRQRHLQHGRRNTGRVRQRGLEKRLRAGRQRRDRHRQTGRRQPPLPRRVCRRHVRRRGPMDGQRGRLVFADAHADGQLVRTPDVQREHRGLQRQRRRPLRFRQSRNRPRDLHQEGLKLYQQDRRHQAERRRMAVHGLEIR